ncbi:MAG TPA: hypothetical protein VH280_20295 [Verrucomicrobiae bacterium]|jgi:hypothetical protein|nr:hypothetical protein [Verrucomicrobiae bacterium]
MKTEIYPRRGPLARSARLALCGAAVIATLTAGTLSAAPSVQTLGGGDSTSHTGYKDGETLYALFNTPKGLALDGSGDLFIADYGNNAIRMLTDLGGPNNGETLTYATNGVNAPVGVVVDSADNLYILNRGGTGAVSTNGTIVEYDVYGLLVGTNASHLTNAAAIALDKSGNIYVTERTNLVVEYTAATNFTVATVTATNALLQGIAVLPSGNLAVCDSRRNGIYTIDPGTGIWTTNAGFNGVGDGTGPNNIGIPNSLAKFVNPYGVAAAGDGTLIVSDYGNDRVKVITAAGITTNLYGVSSNDWVSETPPLQYPGWVDGTVAVPDALAGVAGRSQAGVVLSPDGTTIYTTEDYYDLIRRTTGASFATFVTAPAAPIGLSAVVQTNGQGLLQVVLTWSPVTTGNVTNYLVESAPSSGGPYTIIGETTGTTFTDTTVSSGGKQYFYVIQAANSGGPGPISQEVSVTTPTLPPAPPTIGWYDYEFIYPEVVSVFHPLTNAVYVTYNDLSYAVDYDGTVGQAFYISGPTPFTNSPNAQNGTTIGTFSPGKLPTDSEPTLIVSTYSNLTIKAITEATASTVYSAVSSVQIIYQCATPVLINATNAALFYISDATTNVTYYYTTDGTDPLTNQIQSQSLIATNSVMTIGVNVSSNFTCSVRAFRSGYMPSTLVSTPFFAKNFQANELTWGFASGYCSSKFVASPGQIFYAPVTLTTLPGTSIYSMGFNMTVTNLGPDPVPFDDYSFSSMLDAPTTQSNTTVTVYYPILPLEFVGLFANPPPPGQIVNYNGTNFENMVTYGTNNELAVAWVEMYGKTNLYVTTKQTLISYSEAFLTQLTASPGVIVGGYSFQVPTNAQPGEQYEIHLQNPAADNDGMGADGSAVMMDVPTDGSLSNGPINGIKIVTVGQPRYMAGDVYPFDWFNAGDFGKGDLSDWIDDIQEVFDYAIYDLNPPQVGSDFADAMDSAGGFGAYDAAAGYWTNSNVTATGAAENALFDPNNNNLNTMPFGNGVLDICDVYVTFLRANFPNLYWWQRFYTNDTVNGVFARVAIPITSHTNVSNGVSSPAGRFSLKSAMVSTGPVSITNTPTIHFAAGDYVVSAGQTNLSIPVTATVYGQYPLCMLMFNVSVTPLDGSPDITTPVTFSPNAPFNNSSIYNSGVASNSTVNCAQAFLPVTYPVSSSAYVTGSNVIGYLNVTIPANAPASSAYALSFAHASASPNGLVSFPRTTYTGLITLSSRTNSTYNDGIPDSWRLRYFGTINNELSVSNADADGTGMNNGQKYLAGLDPTDPTSVLKAGTDQKMAQSPQDMVLYWPTVNGQTYVIKRSPTLFPGQWTAISTNIGDGTYMEIHDTSGGPNRYYEVTTPQ